MIKVRYSKDRGHFDHGWLNTFHTFSFGEYRDPNFMRFSVLRVLNQDRVMPGEGFPTHAHKDMEIVSYVLGGVLEHKDVMGNTRQLKPGEVQLMSAGSGVTHSEYNGTNHSEVHFLQMWIIPEKINLPPGYQQKVFPEEERRDALQLVVSPTGESDSLTIAQDAYLYLGTLDGDKTISYQVTPHRCVWLHLGLGEIVLNGELLKHGDGAAITDGELITLSEGKNAEFVLWDLPAV